MYVPKEPMDTYLCVLLDLSLISSPGQYAQTEICRIIAQNQTAFNTIYNNPTSRLAAVTNYTDEMKLIDVLDKEEDCG